MGGWDLFYDGALITRSIGINFNHTFAAIDLSVKIFPFKMCYELHSELTVCGVCFVPCLFQSSLCSLPQSSLKIVSSPFCLSGKGLSHWQRRANKLWWMGSLWEPVGAFCWTLLHLMSLTAVSRRTDFSFVWLWGWLQAILHHSYEQNSATESISTPCLPQMTKPWWIFCTCPSASQNFSQIMHRFILEILLLL